MRSAVELPNVHNIIFVLENSRLVIIYIQIVWSRENRHYSWELCRASFAIHAISALSKENEVYNTPHPVPHVP